MTECICDYTNNWWVFLTQQLFVKSQLPDVTEGKTWIQGGRFGGGGGAGEEAKKRIDENCCPVENHKKTGTMDNKIRNENKYSVTKEFVTFAFMISPPPPRSTDTQADLAGKCWVANCPFLKSHYQSIRKTLSSAQYMLAPPSYSN
jgi:hypothetical protein